MCLSDNQGSRSQLGHRAESVSDEATDRLRVHILALEKELAEYGRKYGFTESARGLLARPIAV
jgi:hypothetical protein